MKCTTLPTILSSNKNINHNNDPNSMSSWKPPITITCEKERNKNYWYQICSNAPKYWLLFQMLTCNMSDKNINQKFNYRDMFSFNAIDDCSILTYVCREHASYATYLAKYLLCTKTFDVNIDINLI